jgi:hypothetical protein
VEEKLEHWLEEGSLFDSLEQLGVPFVVGRHTDLPSQADIPPGVLAATLNQHLRVS